MASLTIERAANAWVDRARAYKVMVDGNEVGSVKRGETQTFQVPPGPHEVHMKIDWTRSPSVEADFAEGTDVRLHVKPNANPFTVLWYVIFARKKYLSLDRAPAGQLTA